ncbi:MAG: hypothetical protein ACK4R9_11870, partial [Ignavibacterium sp.]
PSNKLFIDIERRELRFSSDSIVLEPMDLLFYYFFVDSKLRGINKISVYNFIDDETKNQFIEYYTDFFPNIDIKERDWYTNGFSKEDFRVKRSRVNSKINELIEDTDIASFFIIDVNRKYGESTYHIKAEKERFIIK